MANSTNDRDTSNGVGGNESFGNVWSPNRSLPREVSDGTSDGRFEEEDTHARVDAQASQFLPLVDLQLLLESHGTHSYFCS